MAASEIRSLTDRAAREQRLHIARRRSSLAGTMAPDFIALGIIWYIVFLFSTTCHEGAHSLAARIGGDPTAFHGGQASLNPWPHIQRSPFGMVVVPVLTYLLPPHWMFGWASAPYDPAWQRQYPHRAAWMALAGPGANFALTALAAVGIRVGIALGYLRIPQSVGFAHIAEATGPGAAQFAATFLSILFVLNVLLGTFNLLPVPPLDGHTGVTLLMTQAAALRFLNWTNNQNFGLIGIVLAWVVYDRIFAGIFRLALALLYPGSRWG
jgi:Zn-dependent protease